MRRSKSKIVLALTLAIGLVAAGCGGDDDEGGAGGGELEAGQTYTVGYAASQTGRLTFFEEPFLRGLELAVEQINEQGGIDGKAELVLDVRDSQSDPSTTGTVVRELIDEGAQFIITPCDADVSLPGAQIAQREGVPILNSCGSGSNLPAQVGEFQFMNTYGTVAEGAAMAELAMEQGHESGFFMLSRDIFYTQSIPESAQEVWEQEGGEVAGTTTFEIQQPRYPAQATEVASADPEVLITSIFVPDSVSFLKGLRGNGYQGPVLMNDGNDAPILFEAGNAANNVFVATHAFPQNGNEAEQFQEAFEAKYGNPPESVFAMLGGDAARLIDAAVTDAGTTDPQAVQEAFASLEGVQGVTGEISYAGAPEPGVPIKDIVFQEAKNGKFAFVDRFYPETVPEVGG